MEAILRQGDCSRIRALPLFADISKKNFGTLLNAAFLQRFPPRVSLIAEGGLPDFLHVVIEGSIELFAAHDDHETTIDIVRPVTTFILAAVVRDDVYLKSARTLTPAQILMIPAQAVRDVFGRDAGFARAVVNELADRYRGMVRALKNEKLRPSAERLANWLLHAQLSQGRKRIVELDVDKRTLASLLGMTPENLSRNFALLTKHGVRNTRRGVLIEDIPALAKFAKPNPLIDA